jgi:hypothetical protein
MTPRYLSSMRKLDFLIIGAQKAGTTSLRAFLGSIESHIFMLKTEQHFWNREGRYRDGFGLDPYMEKFSEAGSEHLIGEKSPSYLSSYEAPERIAKHFPQVKLIANLRNPAERAYSAYWHGRRVGAIDPSVTFAQSIQTYQENHGKPYGDLVSPGFYSSHLTRHLNFFPKDQLLVLDFDKLLSSPETELLKSLAFLGLDVDAVAKSGTLEFPKRNVARVSRLPKVSHFIHRTKLLNYDQKSKVLGKILKTGDIPPMEPADREFLAALYKDEGEKIEALTGVKFDWKF